MPADPDSIPTSDGTVGGFGEEKSTSFEPDPMAKRETLELVHKGHNRDSYARGALLAAKFMANRPAGRYTMSDVLGL